MARSAVYGPFHHPMGRVAPGSGGAGQPPYTAPSFDVVGSGIQDARLAWNSGSGTSPQIIGWYEPGLHPVLDVVPATLGVVSVAASQTPTAGVALTLVSSSGAGITVSSSATLLLPSGLTAPAGTLFSDSIPVYRFFGNIGAVPQLTACYDAATMLSRCVTIHSAGNDSSGTGTVVGYDMYGYVQHATVTLGNAGNVSTTKAFKGITSVTLNGTLSGSAVSVGMGDVFGLPFYASALSSLSGYWNNLILYGTGTFVAGVTTSPATALTGDPRGTWLPASASDGSKRLTMFARPSIAQMISAGVNIGMFGVAPF